MRFLSLLLAVVLIAAALPVCLAEGGFPVCVTDAAGREVVFDCLPERIVSGNYITSSMLLALGLRDRLVGVEAKADTRSLYRLAAPELTALPSVGSMKEFSLETVVSLAPDLVVLPLRLKDAAESLTAMGLKTVLIDTECYEGLVSAMELLAHVTGTDAAPLLAYCEGMQSMMADKTADLTPRRVYLSGNSDFLLTAGSAMFQDTLLTMAGGENVASAIGDSYWASVSYEQLLAWDPEVIIMAADAAYTREDLMSDPLLQGLTAVRNGEVYPMPSAVESWDSPVPASVLGSLFILQKLYPALYSQEELLAEIRSFYETFYGVSVTGELPEGL